jgi:hypothetical protein
MQQTRARGAQVPGTPASPPWLLQPHCYSPHWQASGTAWWWSCGQQQQQHTSSCLLMHLLLLLLLRT